MRRALVLLVLGALVALVVVGLSQAGSGTTSPRARAFDLRDAQRELAGAPGALAGLHAQSAHLLGGGRDAFDRRLRALRGHPVVINKWASWCRPCRAEFPHFQAEGTRLGKRVAFLGLNSGDRPAAARRFLARFPVPFPSYGDPDEDIAAAYRAAKFYPMTVFVDARGKIAFVHPGQYTSARELAADIERYLKVA